VQHILKANPIVLGVAQVHQTSKATLEVMVALIGILGKFVAEGHERGLQGEDMNYLCFFNATMSGFKEASLVDIDATHNLVSEQTTTTLHQNPKSSMAMFK